ncbi:MAG: undecaprenyl-phosphate glucose phosphotransferase [Muribaculum sp.]|nr:undecaprenyl-phosphate glucose phosphotransferase [Muribaculum sp.]
MLRKGKYGKYLHVIESLLGFAVVNLAFLIATLSDKEVLGFRWKVTLLIVNVCYLPVVFYRSRYPQGRALHLDIIAKNAIAAVGIHALFFFSILAFLNSWVDNMSFYLWFYGILVILLPLGWALTRLSLKYFRRNGINSANAVIIGSGESAIRLRDAMRSDPGYGYRFMGFFDNDTTNAEALGSEYLGTIDSLEDFMNREPVNEVYYTLSGEDHETLRRCVRYSDNHVAQFYYVPQLNQYVSRVSELSNIGKVPILNIRENPLKRISNRYLKRGFDLVFSSAFLLLSPIVFLPIAIAIKVTSPGPVFFKQKRTGYLGKDFNCLKFRTMQVNTTSDTQQAVRQDPRVTKIGNFLRRTSLDELPQFINVWLGDMSVVGPRPHMIKHTADYSKLIDKYMLRHLIKPGITGWAQINGFRGQTEELWQMEKRVEHDVWYIENWNFFLDIKIIILTAVNMFRGDDNAF